MGVAWTAIERGVSGIGGNVNRADVVTATALLPAGLAGKVLGFVAVVDGRVAGIQVDIRDFNAAVLMPLPRRC